VDAERIENVPISFSLNGIVASADDQGLSSIRSPSKCSAQGEQGIQVNTTQIGDRTVP